MDFTLTIGWWVLPALVTIASIYLALREGPAPSGRDYGASGVISLMFLMAALIVSLIAWLVWAVLP